jgi:hypothetical protein
MTTAPGPRTMPPSPSSNGYRAEPAPTRRGGLSTKQRTAGGAIAAVLVILVGGVMGYYAWNSAGAKVEVVVSATDIPVGHVIGRSDLTTTALAGDITAVAGGHLDSLVGQTAVVEVLPGTPVQRAMVEQSYTLAPGMTLVGVAEAAGQTPSSGLRSGDKVEVLQLPDKNAAPGAAFSPVLAASVVVWDIRDNPNTGGGSLLSLIVPAAAAEPIAAASNAGLVAIVRVG